MIETERVGLATWITPPNIGLALGVRDSATEAG